MGQLAPAGRLFSVRLSIEPVMFVHFALAPTQFFISVFTSPAILYFPPLLLGLLVYLPSYLDGYVHRFPACITARSEKACLSVSVRVCVHVP